MADREAQSTTRREAGWEGNCSIAYQLRYSLHLKQMLTFTHAQVPNDAH